MKKIFVIYLIWHAISSYTLLSDFPLYFTEYQIYRYIMLFSYLNTAFLAIVPTLYFVFKSEARPMDLFWLKMCIGCLLSKFIFMGLAVMGYNWYSEVYALTMFMVFVCYIWYLMLNRKMHGRNWFNGN